MKRSRTALAALALALALTAFAGSGPGGGAQAADLVFQQGWRAGGHPARDRQERDLREQRRRMAERERVLDSLRSTSRVAALHRQRFAGFSPHDVRVMEQHAFHGLRKGGLFGRADDRNYILVRPHRFRLHGPGSGRILEPRTFMARDNPALYDRGLAGGREALGGRAPLSNLQPRSTVIRLGR